MDGQSEQEICLEMLPHAQAVARAFVRQFPAIDAAELHSAANLGLLEAVRSYDGRGTLAGWVNFVAARACRRAIRHGRRTQSTSVPITSLPPEILERTAVEPDHAPAAASGAELRRLIIASTKTIDPADLATFRAFVAGKPRAQIAREANESEGTIVSRIRRVRRGFIRAITPKGWAA